MEAQIHIQEYRGSFDQIIVTHKKNTTTDHDISLTNVPQRQLGLFVIGQPSFTLKNKLNRVHPIGILVL